MELDGQLVVESDAIMRLLEQEFPESTPLMPPPGSAARERADALPVLVRALAFLRGTLLEGAGDLQLLPARRRL